MSLMKGWADLDRATLARAVEVTGATGGVIAVVHDGRLVVVAAEGVATPVGADVSLRDTMLDHARVAGDTLVLSTAEAIERFPAMRTFAPAHLGWAAGPLRMCGQMIGALGLRFDTDDWPRDSPVAQLEYALTGRVAIEQAKGVLAGRHDVTVEQAFETIRRHARSRQRRLRDVARDIMDGRLDPMTAGGTETVGFDRPLE